MASIARFAPAAVSSLISFLSYGSQLLFRYIDPGPLDFGEALKFNILLCCLWICYARACSTHTGHVPSDWTKTADSHQNGIKTTETVPLAGWCKKCERPKPARAHHCKSCRRCIPKMDHHCIWTANCVSHRTFPHFLRFLCYAVTSMMYLGYFLFIRARTIWDKRMLPSYLGPSVLQLASLFVLMVVNFFTCFAVVVVCLRTLWSLWTNVTSIESWEIERHENLVERARRSGGYLDGPHGAKVRIVKQEFPYDIGIWSNLVQGMGRNPLTWVWPLARTPPNETGLEFDVNGFEDLSTTWPPPDPDKMPKKIRSVDGASAFVKSFDGQGDSERVQAFRSRQQADFARFEKPRGLSRRHHWERNEDDAINDSSNDFESDREEPASAPWRNAKGDSLGDYGVDEAVNIDDEDEVPLGRLLSKKKTAVNGQSAADVAWS